MTAERPMVFPCGADSLVGILHPASAASSRGVLVVVGGPQYRVGSHRQFLHLARHLAASGVPVMRMDYRGMGDSDGEYLGFEFVGEDIRAAIDAFQGEVPGLAEIVLWGLCDAASAIAFYARTDPRVAGIVLVNPWARTESGEAKAYIRHYFPARLVDRAFWRKLLAGRVDPVAAAGSFLRLLATATGGADHDRGAEPADGARHPPDHVMPKATEDPRPLADRMLEGVEGYDGQVLVVVSGRDLTAREFEDAVTGSKRWRRALDGDRIRRHAVGNADHTFSRHAWKTEVASVTAEWLGTW